MNNNIYQPNSADANHQNRIRSGMSDTDHIIESQNESSLYDEPNSAN